MKLTRTQLKQIIREEIQNLTEATRSHLGFIDKGGKIYSTYVHWDGYPKGVGQTAKKYYSGGKIKKLLQVDKGNGISALYPKFDGGPNHSFENPEDGQTIFYGRDRGEKRNAALKGSLDNVSDYIRTAGNRSSAEYVYLYNEKDGKWYYADTSKDKQLKPL